tara:strand:+ start:316 stop:609 length:294 start_codon:yes stop_codon:yes gene_type:complete
MIGKAILEINPNAVFAIYGGDGIDASTSNIKWLEDTTPISNEDINAKVEEIKVRDAHKALRQKSYPSIQDQLDDIFHNGIDGWKETIQAVKDKYPKE